jgi:hypothetical protein
MQPNAKPQSGVHVQGASTLLANLDPAGVASANHKGLLIAHAQIMASIRTRHTMCTGD